MQLFDAIFSGCCGGGFHIIKDSSFLEKSYQKWLEDWNLEHSDELYNEYLTEKLDLNPIDSIYSTAPRSFNIIKPGMPGYEESRKLAFNVIKLDDGDELHITGSESGEKEMGGWPW